MSEFGAFRADQEVSQRRFLTIVFVDLVGFTEMTEHLDPEDLEVLLRRYQRLALTVMERFTGFVARVVGDGILIYFGYPVAHENDAERALLAALELLQRLRSLDTMVHGRTMPVLEARVGIHSGLLLIAQELMSAGTSHHGVVGEAVNLAARLQAEAPAGGIAISQETLELVEGLFEYVSLGQKSIKGLSRKVEVHQVLGALSGATRTRTRLRRGAANLVAREDAIDSILLKWQTAKSSSRCQVVAITGDAGVGKTRLVLVLCGRPELAGASLLQASCHEIFASTPLYPVINFFWARAGLTVDDDEAARMQKIASYLDELGLASDENREIVVSLLGVAATSPGVAVAATPQLLKRRQYEFVVDVIRRAARAQPTLLWIEDAHWLDPSSAELLHEAVAAAADLPLLVLITMRSPPARVSLPTTDAIIQLEQLGVQDCVKLARLVPGADALPDEMIMKAVEAAEGVPLFVEQLVISLLDEQSQSPGQHRRLGGVPLMLAEMLSERLDRRPGARRIAQAAACIGRSFTSDFLLELLGHEPQTVQDGLQALMDAEILLPKRYGAEIHYEFRHALLQRMAHESMIQSERRNLHGRIVAVLRASAGPEPVIHEVLAHHLTEAGAYPEAIGGWLQAGVTAATRSAHVEAIDHIRKGLALLERLADSADRRGLELKLQVSLMGSILATQSATSQQLATCCERGLALCQESGATALVFPFAFGQFTFVNCRGRCQEAMRLANLFVTSAERNGLDSERVIGHRMLGHAHLALADAAAARTELELSLKLYVSERDAATTHMYGQNTQVHTKSLLSLAYLCLGDVDAALKTGLDALETADSLRHPHSTAIPLVYVGGWVFGLCDAFPQMMQQAKQLFALAEQHRLKGFRAHAGAFLGWSLCCSGELEQGIAALTKAIAAYDEVEFRISQSGHLANLADALRRAGRLDDAAAASKRAISLMHEGSLWLEPELRRIDAMIMAELAPSETDRAETMFRTALRRAQELRFPVFETRCLGSLARFLRAAGRRDEALESRLGELAHLDNLGRRVAIAMQASRQTGS
jgi:class 3 adenylate cyclase/tetratricopeptide (TPR) repeat protein